MNILSFISSFAQYQENMQLWALAWTAPHCNWDILLSLQFLCCWTSLSCIFTSAECRQSVHWTIWEASPLHWTHIWFDRAKQHELMTYEKWQISHVFNCETNSTGDSFNITSVMYKRGYVLGLFISFLEKSTLSPTDKLSKFILHMWF